MKILLVEDHADLADMSCRLLREVYGHEVQLAATGAKALEAANDDVPDLVLLDINLPDMSGFEVARKLRSHPGFDHTSLIAVTGFGAFIDENGAEEIGLDGFFRKPMDFELLEQLKRA